MIEFLKKIFAYFRADPTTDWPVFEPTELIFNLEERRLNEAVFGDSFEALKKFGKPTNAKPLFYKTFQYARHGLLFEMEDTKIGYMSFIFENENGEHFESSKVTLRNLISKEIELKRGTKKNELVQCFGDPGFFEKDEEEIILEFEINAMKIEFELDLSEKIKRMNVYPSFYKTR